jgi:uncharacterized protein (DUF362 family)
LANRIFSLALAALLVFLPGCRSKGNHAEPAPARIASSSTHGVAVAPAPSRVAPEPAASSQADVVSKASVVYDAGAPVVVEGKIDGRTLRKRHVERLRSDVSPVTLLRGDSALELGRRICDAVVPERARSTPVLIKPNICGFDGIKDARKSGDDGVRGRVTDAEFVRGVVRCLKARGFSRITIAEGCGNSHRHWLATIRVSGYEAMAKEEDVPLVALDDDGVFDVEGEQPGKPLAISGLEGTSVPTLLMPKLLAETLDHGLFISVPKLKTHRYAVFSLSIKGMQGTVMRSDRAPAYNQKWRMHAELKDYLKAKRNHEPEDRQSYVHSLELFAKRMVDVFELETPDVVLVDGAPAMSGDGFQNVRALPDKVALGGTNPVLVDRIGAQFLGLWNNAQLAAQLGGHRTSPLLELAARRFGIALKAPAVTGDGVSLLEKPRPVFFKALAPFTLDGDRVVIPPAASAKLPTTSEASSTRESGSPHPAP